MIQRCETNSHKSYEYYGGRGIKVCDRWHDIKNFIEDMHPSYQEGLTLDRIDVDGNYDPSNCRWVTHMHQSRNTRKIRAKNTSGYRGVYKHTKNDSFIANISLKGKTKNIGSYKTAKEAAIAYDTFVIVYGLEHTTNFPRCIFEHNVAKCYEIKKEG